LGDAPGARRQQDEALQVFTDIGDKRGMGATLGNLGNLLADLGELQAAVNCYERGLRLDQETGYKRGIGFVLAGWGRALIEQDKLSDARSKLEESLKIRKEIGNADMIGDTLLALAQLTLAEGDPAESSKLSADAVLQFVAVKAPDDEASANAALAKSLVVEQKIPQARAAADRALAHKGSDFQQQFDAIVAGALVEAASGKAADANKKLEAAQLQARKLNFNGDELEARLELGKIRMKSERSEVAHAELTSLERDAKAKGYIRIARDAATTLNQSPTLR
jgi:tetratricopeptide (TPR) repeat protein